MATIKATITRVDEFENGKQLKLSVDTKFNTLRNGMEVEVDSLNFRNIDLQQQLKKFSKLFRRIELFCMGHRAKPQLFKVLLENGTIEVEQVLHKAGETRGENGEINTFDYYQCVIKGIDFPELDDESLADLKDLMVNPKMEKPISLQSNDELIKLLYNK